MRAAIKKNNRRINRLRSVVKRTIAHIKNWRVLHTGLRRSLGSYSRVFSSGAGADFFSWRRTSYEYTSTYRQKLPRPLNI